MTQIEPGSLILTVLNEAETLPAFLQSLAAQTTLPAEIVVVDGGSTDATEQLLQAWNPPAGCTMRVSVIPGASISEGRNEAVRLAAFDKIIVTDAGTTMDERWAEKMLGAFSGDSAQVVCGFFRPVGETWMERTIAFTVTPRLSEIDGSTFLPSSRSIGFTRSAWSNVGGYPEWLDYCEDLIFDIKMKELGIPFAFVGDAVVSWSARPSLPAFMKQYYRYARGDGKSGLWAKRHAARYLAYLAGIGLLIAAFASPLFLLVLLVGMVMYMRKFWQRIWRGRREFGPGLAAALLAVPLVVVLGDLAKMCGYPAGLRWRSQNRHQLAA